MGWLLSPKKLTLDCAILSSSSSSSSSSLFPVILPHRIPSPLSGYPSSSLAITSLSGALYSYWSLLFLSLFLSCDFEPPKNETLEGRGIGICSQEFSTTLSCIRRQCEPK
ncbi:hypothetical protein J5N97_009821 [Dioscorea zingiberensis]|uniref:Uncharacterized protein n=1 Tax=Dioscorea zingiberensis TaxID=325984 RepID=A0A9D5CXW5_9LILI|nr:hypothetical protein J5N97_009821 [Dioscorea zingiberensis]